jgi:hypothetical protein
VTITVTPTAPPTSTSFVVSPTYTATPNTGISKTTIIILAIFVPLVALLAMITVWRVVRTRHKQPKLLHEQLGSPVQRWIAKVSRIWSAKNKSADELPRQTADGEGKESKDGSRLAMLLPPAAPTPPGSTFRVDSSHLSRPPRPPSLSGSMKGVMRTGSPALYTHARKSEHDEHRSSTAGIGNTSPQSWSDIPTDQHPQAYDGTRRAFYETALNRNLPFDRLARPSLRLERQQDAEPDRSLTPDPLRIIKNTDSTDTVTELQIEREGGMRRAHTEPPNPWAFIHREAVNSLEQDLMDELSSIDDGPIDEETRRKQREDTLNYLEGVLPMSPPASYRASSVYSRNQWGSPSLDEEEYSPATVKQNRTVSGDHGEPKGKEKAVDQSGAEGKWL